MSVSVVKARDFEKAATKKGFVVQRDNRDHITFFYRDEDGKINPRIRTKISHGSDEISASNLSKMKLQLKFKTMEKFQQYIKCTFSLAEYRQMLKEQGFE